MASLCLVLLLLFIQIVSCSTDAPCYYPGGGPAKGHFPCDQFAYATLCCPQGWTCFSNDLCVVTDPSTSNDSLPLGTSIRGSCTNPLWNNAQCGGFCLEDGNDGSLTPCGNQHYCCQSNIADGSCGCDTGKGAFSLSDGIAQTIIGVVGLKFTQIPSISVSSSHSAPSTSSSPSKVVSTTGSTLSSFSTPATTSVATTTSTPQTRPTVKTTGFKVGVGVAAAFVAIGLLAFALWYCRHNRMRPFNRRRETLAFEYPQPETASIRSQPGLGVPAAPNPHPYDPSNSATSPIRTPPPQTTLFQSQDPLTVPTPHPYSSQYSIQGRGPTDIGAPTPHPYQAYQPNPGQTAQFSTPSPPPQQGVGFQDFQDPRQPPWKGPL